MEAEIQIVFWYWWILGVVLMILELLAPGVFFLWMGISAILIGVLTGLWPDLGWQYQVFYFSLLSVLSVVFWRMYLAKHPTQSDRPLLNRRSAQYVGRVFTLEQAIENGQGKIKVDDSVWKIQGDDCPIGSRVKIVAADSVILRVQRIDG